MASIQYSNSAIGNFTYGWNPNHNKTSESISGVMSGYGFTASYDYEDRLTGWTRSDAALTQSWNLSAVGNLDSITQNASTQTRTHSPANELLTAAGQSAQMDAKGNTTLLPANLSGLGTSLGLKWDSNNKLRAADTNNDGTDDVLYLWDALGRRVGRTASGITTVYFQNGEQTLADYTLGALPSSPTSTYLWGDYIDELVMRTSTGGNYYFHRNQQYSVTAVTTSTGAVAERYAYTAYGQPTILNASGVTLPTSAFAIRHLYTGREWDQTLGLYHFRARWMSPTAGRFMGRDPIGYIFPMENDEFDDEVLPDVAHLQPESEFNLYQFADDGPLNKIDATGNFWTCLPAVVTPRPCTPADDAVCNTHCFALGHASGTARACRTESQSCTICFLINYTKVVGRAKCACTSPSWNCVCPTPPAGCVLATKSPSNPGRLPKGGCECRWHCRGAGGRPIITKPVRGIWKSGPNVTVNV